MVVNENASPFFHRLANASLADCSLEEYASVGMSFISKIFIPLLPPLVLVTETIMRETDQG